LRHDGLRSVDIQRKQMHAVAEFVTPENPQEAAPRMVPRERRVATAEAATESLTDLIDRLDRIAFLRSLEQRRPPVLTRHLTRGG
jgi:hypothetical protein